MEIVLYHPEIPPNTGNIARLCAAMNVSLHLIEPLGFSLDDKYLKRAGLDYWPYVRKYVWSTFDDYLVQCGKGKRLVMTSSRSGTSVNRFAFLPDDVLVFGPESKGLPPDMLDRTSFRVRIPLRNVVRSLNLSTSAGIILYAGLARCGLLEENSLC